MNTTEESHDDTPIEDQPPAPDPHEMAEKKLLGVVLWDEARPAETRKGFLRAVAPKLAPEDLGTAYHQDVLRAIGELREARGPVEPVTPVEVREHLMGMAEIHPQVAADGLLELGLLEAAPADERAVVGACAVVMDAAIHRGARSVGATVAQAAQAPEPEARWEVAADAAGWVDSWRRRWASLPDGVQAMFAATDPSTVEVAARGPVVAGEAERQLLWSLISDPSQLAEVDLAGDELSPAGAHVLGVLREARMRGMTVDDTAAAFLAVRRGADPAELEGLFEETTPRSAGFLAERVAEEAQQRGMAAAGEQLQADGADVRVPPGVLLERGRMALEPYVARGARRELEGAAPEPEPEASKVRPSGCGRRVAAAS